MKEIPLHIETRYLNSSGGRYKQSNSIATLYFLLCKIFAKQYYIRNYTTSVSVNISSDGIAFPPNTQKLFDISVAKIKTPNIKDITLVKDFAISKTIQKLIIHFQDNISGKKEAITLIAMNDGLNQIHKYFQNHGIKIKHRMPILLAVILISIGAFVLFIVGIITYQAFS